MKKIIFTFLTLFFALTQLCFAQINCKWAFNPLDVVYPTPAYNQFGSSIVADNSGNVYVTGALTGSIDFDPGTGTNVLTSAGADDIFIAKYDANGNLIFANRMGSTSGEQGAGITLDAAGNIYITGLFNGTVDFDPGAGLANLVCSSGADVFFAKYDASGNYIYAKGLPGSNIDMGISIAADAAGNAYVAGYFWGTVDFNPGTGTAYLSGAGRTDAFIGKYDASGNYILAKKFGSTLNDYGNAVVVDATGNIYLVGAYQGTVDFDPGTGTANLTAAGSTDCFIAKYDNSMNYIFAKSMGGTAADNVAMIRVNAGGSIYVTGNFNGTADFDPGAGVVNLVSAGGDDVFIASYDASGSYVYAKSMGGTGIDVGNSLVLDSDGNVLISGYFSGVADFDPGAGTANLVSTGSYDIIIARYDANGNYLSANGIGGSGDDRGYSIATDASKYIYVTGHFNNTVDFEPGTDVINLSSLNSQDMFIAKYGAPEINVQGNSINIADGDVTPNVTDGTDFGSTCNNGTFVSTFTIQNTGNMILNISSINVVGTDAALFSLSGVPSSVAAGSSAAFDVLFSAWAGGWGVKNAAIQINSNDFDEGLYDFDIKATVEDNSKPTFTCHSDQNLCEGYSSLYIAPGNLGDNCFGPVTVTYKLSGATTGTGSDDASNESFNSGTTQVTYIFADQYGNKDSCMFNVTVNPVYHFIESQEICGASPLTWHGNTYSNAGTYYDNHTSKFGCDSNYTLNLSVIQAAIYYADDDGDSYGNFNDTIRACSMPAGYVLNFTDCNDANPNINPGATEKCNGLDDNCNGQTDEAFPDLGQVCYAGIGQCRVSGVKICDYSGLHTTCSAVAGMPTVEICDGIDNDCDGQVDEGVLNTYYRDADSDGYGALYTTIQACSAPFGYVSNSTDCDDTRASVHPGATEITGNGIDEDCNGKENCYGDIDHDTYGSGIIMSVDLDCADAGEAVVEGDCNDNNPAVHPGALEIYNGIDDDCSGQTDDGLENFMAAWGYLQNPNNVTIAKNQTTPYIYGEVWKQDVTSIPLTGGVGVWAELGYGPLNSNPTSASGWTWVSGVFNQDIGNNDQFKATLTPTTPGVYAVAWRFSLNGGYSWLYCDASGTSASDPYDPAQQGMMTVINNAPTLTTINTLTGADEDSYFNISYTSLAAAANEADLDGDELSFRIESVTTGILTKGGSAVVPGTTLLSYGESLSWNAGANVNGVQNAFTVVAWDGTAVSTPPVQVQINVQAINDPPVVNAGPDIISSEGATYSRTGSWSDPDAGDTHTGTVTYGDGGSPVALTLNQSNKTYTTSHSYADNGVYNVAVKIMDQTGAYTFDYLIVTVNNVAPVVNAGMDAIICKGSTFSQSGSFTDPGSDTFTAQVNYGDGSAVQALTVNQAAKTFDLNHVYTDIGTFTITVNVTDDDGGLGTDYVQVTVNPSYNFTETVTKCSWASYTWRGQNYSTAGVYHDNLHTLKGCDSIYTLILNDRVPVPEICNGIDDDCDGTVDEGVMNQFYTDNDNDGYGTGQVIFACVQPANTSTNNTDCNDNNPNQNAGFYIYADQDNDGYHYGQPILLCSGDPVPDGYSLTTNGMDCNDTDAGVHIGATEICNGKDDDCDGTVDEGMPIITFYADNDADGYGYGAPMNGCIQPQNTSLNNTDCNDNNPSIHPGAQEIFNGIDDDCSGQADDGLENFIAAWGDLYTPISVALYANQVTPNIYGRVYKNSVTNIPNNAGVGILAQLGYGPLNSEPASAPGWNWVNGVFQSDMGQDDVFRATLSPTSPGVFAYAWRFSLNGGYSWLYCDRSGVTPSDPYNIIYQGVMTVYDPSLAEWGDLYMPVTVTQNVNQVSPNIYGRVYKNSVTNIPNNAGVGILAQLGYGPLNSEPASTPGWNWVTGVFYSDMGQDDVFMAALTPTSPGVFAYAWRFSLNSGNSWLYCDRSGVTPSDPYSVNYQGVMTVNDIDADGDGYYSANDCDDNNNAINPGATEVCGNGLDDDCDGQIDECFTLTVNKTGGLGIGGTITSTPAGIDCGGDCSYLFPEGTLVTVNATPLNGATFAGWTGACTGSGSCSVEMTANKTISARFTYTVTVTKSGNGTGYVSSSPSGINCGASCSMTFDAGSNITLTATPNAGSVFAGWSGNGCIGTGNCNLWMNENKTGDAQFTCILPETATPISGPSTVCRDQNIQTYSVLPIPLATSYQWTLPGGCSGFSTTNTIQVTFGTNYTTGNISVRGLNDCGPGLSSSITVTATNPEVTITTSTNPACPNSQVIFTAATTNGGTNPGYHWFVNDTLKFTNMASSNRLILHSPFNGNADDISGQGLNGTVFNANLTNDRHGNPNRAYSFNGNDAYIDYGDHDTLNPHYSDITISAWVKKDALSQHSRIYSKGTHGGYQAGYDLMFYGWGSPSRAACIFAVGGHEHIAYSNNPVEDFDWHHYAAKISRQGYICLYVDGVIQNDSVYIGDHSSIDIANGTLNAAVGASYSYYGGANVNEYFYGSIDEVMVYKRALSASEIQSLFVYNNTSGSEFSYIPKQNDKVKCVVVSDQSCVFSTTDTSNVIQMGVIQPSVITPAGPVILLANTTRQLSVTTFISNPFYQWKRNGDIIIGANNHTYTVSEDGWYTCTVSGDNCIASDSVQVFKPQVEITTADTNICVNSSAQLKMEISNVENGSLCGMVNEDQWLQMTAPDNGIFTSVIYASYGTPVGDCGAFTYGWCHAVSSMSIIENACLGKNSFGINASNSTFGDPCGGTYKRLYVEAAYTHLNIHYLWSTGDTTAHISISPNASGWVYCTVSIEGMSFKDSIYIQTISVFPGAADVPTGPQYVNPGQTQVTYTVAPVSNATAYKWYFTSGITGPGNSYTIITPVNSVVVDFDAAFSYGDIIVWGMNNCGEGTGNSISIWAMPATKSLQLKLFLEGLYIGNGSMTEAQGTGGSEYGSGIADKVAVELHSDIPPYNTVYEENNIELSTSGTLLLNSIPGTLSGNHYIAIRHRNSIETWSALPYDFSGAGPYSYDFSTAASQAYGNNQKQFGAVYAIYGGDATQDGVVDGSDMSVIDNGSQPPILHGYYPEDVNGDGVVDGSDMTIIDNNSLAPAARVLRP